MASPDGIEPFKITISDSDLTDLYRRLELTRLPDELDLPLDHAWDWGMPLAVLKPVIEYWRTQYDRRSVEAKINQTLPQFTTHVDSQEHGALQIHFVHKKSNNPAATPLLFVHGWPGSFLEVSKIIDELTNPTDPKHPCFHVVAPSLPGFVFSQRASTPGMDIISTGYVLNKLMSKLGYQHYMAQGGDWGFHICRALAIYHQDTCLGIHTNLAVYGSPNFWRNPIITLKLMLGTHGLPGGYSTEELKGLERSTEFFTTGNGYLRLQATRPQTLAVALSDSPVGLLAWIGEKLHAWTDNYPWTPEEWITWTMLYWFTGPAGGLRFYKESGVTTWGVRKGRYAELDFGWSPTPFAFSSFPKEIVNFPAGWTALRQNLVYFKRHNKGGHFAAWEVPEVLLDDLRQFTRLVVSKDARLFSQ